MWTDYRVICMYIYVHVRVHVHVCTCTCACVYKYTTEESYLLLWVMTSHFGWPDIVTKYLLIPLVTMFNDVSIVLHNVYSFVHHCLPILVFTYNKHEWKNSMNGSYMYNLCTYVCIKIIHVLFWYALKKEINMIVCARYLHSCLLTYTHN